MDIELPDGETTLQAPDDATPEQIKALVQKFSKRQQTPPPAKLDPALYPSAPKDTIGAASGAQMAAPTVDELNDGQTGGFLGRTRAFLRNVVPGLDYLGAAGAHAARPGALTYGQEVALQRDLGRKAEGQYDTEALAGTLAQGAAVPQAKGAGLLPRVARVLTNAGLAGATAAGRGEDAGRAALGAGAFSAGGEAVGAALRGASKAGGLLADEGAKLSLRPTEGDAQLLRQQFGTPNKAGNAIRTAEGSRGRLLPNMATAESRYQGVKDEMDLVGRRRAAILQEAHGRGARLNARELSSEIDSIADEVTRDPSVQVAIGDQPATEASRMNDRFRQAYDRPAKVQTDAAGEPRVMRDEQWVDVNGDYASDPTKQGSQAQWDGRLEGSGPQEKGKNMPRGKRRAMRVEDFRPEQEPFDPTHDSTTRPRPYSGWFAAIDPEKPMTLEEADNLRRRLDDAVAIKLSGATDVKGLLRDPDLRFKLRVADLLRQKVSAQVEGVIGDAHGYEGIQRWQQANKAYSDMATIEPMLLRAANGGGSLPGSRTRFMFNLAGRPMTVAGEALESAGRFGDEMITQSPAGRMLPLMAGKKFSQEKEESK